jgi:hypothetical protein
LTPQLGYVATPTARNFHPCRKTGSFIFIGLIPWSEQGQTYCEVRRRKEEEFVEMVGEVGERGVSIGAYQSRVGGKMSGQHSWNFFWQEQIMGKI